MACSKVSELRPVNLKEEGLSLVDGIPHGDLLVSAALEAVQLLINQGCKVVFALDPFVESFGYKGELRKKNRTFFSWLNRWEYR